MSCIIAFDPGSNYLGVSIFHLDEYTLELIDIEVMTLQASKIKSPSDMNFDITYKIDYLYKYLINIMFRYKPLAITIENPFMFSKRPGAVIPLAKSLAVIEQAAIDFDRRMFIHRISPSEAKNAIGAKGNADKFIMYETLISHKFLSSFIDRETITEHEVDATAMAFKLYTYIQQYPHLLLF